MLGNKLINTNAGGGCTNTVDLYNPFPDGGGVALYQLNGDATDVSGNYDGTASNLNYVAGQFGQGASFNTSNSILTAPRAFSTNSPYSVSGWVKIANGSTTQAARLFWQITGTNQTAVQVNYNGVDSYVFGVTHKFETNGGFSHSFAANDGQWHHYAMTFDGSSANLYIDGANVASGALDPKADVGSIFYIGGGNVYNGITYYNGLDGLDQVRYFSRALRPYEVEALYTEEYCTPTIVPSEHFNTVTYTGNGSTQSVTGVGFEPNLVWIKNRSNAADHALQDTVRGINLTLRSSSTVAEFNGGYVSSIQTDGFTLGSSQSVNASGQTYVSWNFKAGGAAVATGNTNLSNSFVSANPEAGFSIMTYTGTAVDGTINHGLSQAPEFWIYKNRTNARDWFTCTTVIDGSTKYGFLNTSAAFGSGAAQYTTDTVIAVNADGGTGLVNLSGNNYVLYAFHSVEGFSNFGSYAGTGAAGNTIVTGFEPAFVIAKMTSAADSWRMYDNKRIGSEGNGVLYPNSSTSEGNVNHITFLENGFVWNSDNCNSINQDFIYMAFAADPTAVEPTLEDSFNTVLYTGNGGTNTVTGVQFQPDMVWLKDRDTTYPHYIYDSVRGALKGIRPNVTDAESTDIGVTSFNADGFTLDSNAGANQLNSPNVAWAWKGAEIPAINSNGSIPSVVSANPAAGFSIVSCTATGGVDTIGHGLGVAPSVIIYKTRSTTGNWSTYHQSLGNTKGVYLNLTSAVVTSQFFWNNTFPTSDVFTAYGSAGNTHIAYCFAEVAGFSKFGSYTGNGTTSNTIVTGFEPAFIMTKRTDVGGTDWHIWDNKRNPSNPLTLPLFPNEAYGEANYSAYPHNFLSNGFSVNTNNGAFNASGGTYIYMAFANQF